MIWVTKPDYIRIHLNKNVELITQMVAEKIKNEEDNEKEEDEQEETMYEFVLREKVINKK